MPCEFLGGVLENRDKVIKPRHENENIMYQ